MNTKLSLMYRDGTNCKRSLAVILEGEITESQIAIIKSKLDDGEYAITEQVGLPTPALDFAETYNFPTEHDHVWTTMEDFVDGTPLVEDLLTDEAPTITSAGNESFGINELVDRFTALEGWDVEAEWGRLQRETAKCQSQRG